MRNNKGVTLIALTVTVIVLLAISGMLIYNTNNQVKLNKLDNLYIDIGEITSKVDNYYLTYGELPILCDYMDKTNLMNLLNKNIDDIGGTASDSNKINPNDGNEYYVIDLGKLDGISLNYGYNDEYNKVKTNGKIYSLTNELAVEDEIYGALKATAEKNARAWAQLQKLNSDFREILSAITTLKMFRYYLDWRPE